MNGSSLEEKSPFKILGLSSKFSKLNWGSYIVSIANTASKKIGAFVRSMKFLSPEVTVYLNKFLIQPCLKYYCHACSHALSCCLVMVDNLQKQICRTVVGPSLAAFLEPLAHFRNLASLSLFCRHYFGRCSCELAELVPLPHSCDTSTHCFYRLYDFSVIISR